MRLNWQLLSDKLKGRPGRILKSALSVWILLGFLIFLSGIILANQGSPQWLEVPWSDFNDFVEGTDRRVYVNVRFYARVLCYDHDGRFLVSYQSPGNGSASTGLAAGANGLIYYRVSNIVYTYDSQWNLKAKVESDFYADQDWVLGENGNPILAPGMGTQLVINDRPVKSGELLFSSARTSRRETFAASDGTLLKRNGDSLRRLSASGEILARYGTPWYLWWAKWPMPIASAWLALFFFGWLEYRNRRRKRAKGSPPH